MYVRVLTLAEDAFDKLYVYLEKPPAKIWRACEFGFRDEGFNKVPLVFFQKQGDDEVFTVHPDQEDEFLQRFCLHGGL